MGRGRVLSPKISPKGYKDKVWKIIFFLNLNKLSCNTYVQYLT